jgi:hypothetical protein
MALERMETFCNEFKPSDIDIFITVLEKARLYNHTSMLKETSEKISDFVEDFKKGLPHGGKYQGNPKPITEVLVYIVELLKRMSYMIETKYDKLFYQIKKTSIWIYGYDKEYIKLGNTYIIAYDHWCHMIDPLIHMIATPKKIQRSYKIAESRAVNTMNRFNKHISLPKAQPYQGNHFEEMPLATIIRPSLSPQRKSRRTNKTLKSKGKGTRI